MPKPEKIFELTGNDFMRGISGYPAIPVGGIYRVASNFYPFDKPGIFKGVQTASAIAAAVIVQDTKYRVKVDISGNGHIVWFGYHGSTADVYDQNAITLVTTDKSAEVGLGISLDQVRGAGVYKDKILYSDDSYVFANSKNLTLANEVTLISAGLVSGEERIFKTGPDRNMYFTNGNHVGRITVVTGESGNSPQYLSFEDDVIVRDLESDSQHLVIAGDANPTEEGEIEHRCFVSFWNMKSIDITRYWEFSDARIYSIRKIGNGGEFLIIAENGFYVCSVSRPPRPIFLRKNNATTIPLPRNPHGVDVFENSVIWVASNSGQVWGYGSPRDGQDRILFHISSGAGGNGLAIAATDSRILNSHDGTSSTKGVTNVFGGSSGDATAILTVVDVSLERPYELAYCKIVLHTDLTSGDSIALQIGNVLSLVTFSFAVDGARKNFHVPPNDANDLVFEQLDAISMNNIGAEVEKLEIWGYPQDPDQDSE